LAASPFTWEIVAATAGAVARLLLADAVGFLSGEAAFGGFTALGGFTLEAAFGALPGFATGREVLADGAALGFAALAARFGAGLALGLVVDLTGRAAFAFDAATVALDRAFKNSWAAFG